MKLEFVNPGFSYSLDSMMLFEESNQSDWWRDANFYFYPMLKKEELRALPMSERRAYYQSKLEPFWVEKQTEFAEKLDRWNAHWQKHEGVIAQALSEGFDRDLSGKLEKIQGRMALGNVCPRFLEQQAFDVFWMNSERGAMGISMHEITHFIWFDAWNKHFGDAPAEYEQPNLKWILSEMAVYPFLSDPRLIPLNPYYPEEKGGCVYPYFYNMKLEGAPVLETLRRMYRENSLTDFMEAAYAYCQLHEKEIRAHIAAEESKGIS